MLVLQAHVQGQVLLCKAETKPAAASICGSVQRKGGHLEWQRCWLVSLWLHPALRQSPGPWALQWLLASAWASWPPAPAGRLNLRRREHMYVRRFRAKSSGSTEYDESCQGQFAG